MSRETRQLSDKLGLWLRRPDYCPKDLQTTCAPVDIDTRRYRLPNTQASLGLRSYTTLQFFLAFAGLPLLILQGDHLVLHEKALLCALILAALGSITGLLEAQRGATQTEGLRLILSSAAMSLVFSEYVGSWAWLWAALSLLGLMAVRAPRPVQEVNLR